MNLNKDRIYKLLDACKDIGGITSRMSRIDLKKSFIENVGVIFDEDKDSREINELLVKFTKLVEKNISDEHLLELEQILSCIILENIEKFEKIKLMTRSRFEEQHPIVKTISCKDKKILDKFKPDKEFKKTK